MTPVPLLWMRTIGNCKTKAPVSHLSLSHIKKEKSNRKDKKDTPDIGTPELQKNLGASYKSSPRTNSQSLLEIKKKFGFQFQKDDG